MEPRRIAILALVLAGCSDEKPTCDDNPQRGECSVPDLPSRDSSRPWPTFDERRRELDCACNDPRVGACADGKQFAADGVGFAGATLYFRDGQVVGQRTWSDVHHCVDGVVCEAFLFADAECDETSSELIACDVRCDSSQPE